MGFEIQKKEKQKTTEKKNKGDQLNIFGFLNKDIQIGKSLNDKKREDFYSELGILLDSGIDIRTALQLIAAEQKKDKHKKIFEKILAEVIGGKSLSDALMHDKNFTPHEYYTVRIGEETGKITHVLKELSVFYNKKIKQRKQFTGALTYPVIVLVTAVLAVVFMMNFIVPMFKDVFNRFQGDLPPLTQTVINISESFSSHIGAIIFILVSIVVIILLVRKKEWYRKFATAFMLKIPVFGEIIRKIYVARFCQSMALLTGSKTPLLRSIQLVHKMILFYPFEKAMERIEDDVLHGQLLYASMEKFTIFDSRTVSLIKVAEEVNQLDKIFNRLNIQYTEELEHRIGLLSNLLEPIMIIFVGLLVSVILIAMYMPLFQLGGTLY